MRLCSVLKRVYGLAEKSEDSNFEIPDLFEFTAAQTAKNEIPL